MTTRTLVTADELLRMPDDGKRYELIDGELIEMAPAGSRHGEIAASVVIVLGHYVRKNNLGTIFAAETGFLLRYDPDTVRAPMRLHCKGSATSRGVPFGFMTRFPTSSSKSFPPTTGQVKSRKKIEQWIEHGVKLVWLVYPERRSITVYRSLSDVLSSKRATP